jgi:hypothetical protein
MVKSLVSPNGGVIYTVVEVPRPLVSEIQKHEGDRFRDVFVALDRNIGSTYAYFLRGATDVEDFRKNYLEALKAENVVETAVSTQELRKLTKKELL